MNFLLLAIPLLAFALAAGLAKAAPGERDLDKYEIMYRLAPDEPDKYTPGQRQFDPGFLVVTTAAMDVIANAEDAITTVTGQDSTGKLLSHLVTTHSEGDWGDLPESSAAVQDELMAKSGTDFLEVRGIHLIAGTELWIETVENPAGNLTTIFLPGKS